MFIYAEFFKSMFAGLLYMQYFQARLRNSRFYYSMNMRIVLQIKNCYVHYKQGTHPPGYSALQKQNCMQRLTGKLHNLSNGGAWDTTDCCAASGNNMAGHQLQQWLFLHPTQGQWCLGLPTLSPPHPPSIILLIVYLKGLNV